MKQQKPPTFLGSVSFLLVGTLWVIGYTFIALQMLREGYWVTAYASLPFIGLGVVIAIMGVRRFKRFLKTFDEKDSELAIDVPGAN